MTYPIPPAPPSSAASEPGEPQRGRLTPLWMLLVAILLLVAGMSMLVQRPVGAWVAARQPTLTPTLAPTLTPTTTPSPVPTRTPTRTPTVVPTLALENGRGQPGADLAQDLRSITMFDQLNGWGVGWQALYITRDGGQTWTDITPISAAHKAPIVTHLVDDQKAWYFASNGGLDFSGILFYTEDRGRSWSARETWFGGEFPEIFFLPDGTGWVLTYSYNYTRELYRTTNRGVDWAAIHRVFRTQDGRNGYLPETGFLRGPVFRDGETGWIGGTTPIEAGTAFIYESEDSGRLWMLRPLPMDEGYSSMWIAPPKFYGPDQSAGVMVAYAAPLDEIIENQGDFNENQLGVTPVDLPGARYVFFTSPDRGQTWSQATWVEITNPSPFSLPSPGAFFVLDGDTLRYTTNAGGGWGALETGLEALSGGVVQFTGLQFVDESVGWAWGQEGERRMHLYQTRDGGVTWKEIDLAP